MNKIKRCPEPSKRLLTQEAVDHWNYLVPVLVSEGLVSEIDLPILEMACNVYSSYVNALTYEDKVEPMKDYISIMKNFGATSACAQKLKTTEKATRKRNTDDKELLKAFK